MPAKKRSTSASKTPRGNATEGHKKPALTRAEVAKHNVPEDLWMVIHGKVYDCTNFVEEHPGGPDTLVDCGGAEASAEFDSTGHSDSAKLLMKDYYVGDLDQGDKAVPADQLHRKVSGTQSSIFAIFFVIGLLGAVVYFVLKQQKLIDF